MKSELSSIFDAHAREGLVVLEDETVLWHGPAPQFSGSSRPRSR
jgi:hypothetical protein